MRSIGPDKDTAKDDAPVPRHHHHLLVVGPKIAVFQYGTLGVFLFIISGFWRLQIQNPRFFDQLAQENSIKSLPILAPRGRILDREGRVIVDNRSSFTLVLPRESLKKE